MTQTGKPWSGGALPDAHGRFGEFGGQYVPETLMAALAELTEEYLAAKEDPEFQEEYAGLLRDFVGRPTPVYYAARLTERAGGARIFLKREDLAHTGAHKINNALGQALVAKRMAKPRIVAETGAGQHGVAVATVCAMLGMRCVVYMGTEDMRRQEPNVYRMHMLGAEVREVTVGSRTLKEAVSETIRDWVTNVADTHYIIGSVVGPHPYPMMVRDFQTVLGRESPRADNRADGRVARLRSSVRRRRLQLDWSLSPVHRRRFGAVDRRRGRRRGSRDGPARRQHRRRPRRRAARVDVLHRPGRRRPDSRDAQHLGPGSTTRAWARSTHG